MSDPMNFADMSNDDILQLLAYTNASPPPEASKLSPRQDCLGCTSLPSFPSSNPTTLEYPSTAIQQLPNKTDTWNPYAANPSGYPSASVDPTEKRNIMASLDRIEAVVEWIHKSQNRQDARLAKLEDKVDEIKEELAEINQHLTEQAMNCSRCDYGSGDEYSDDATEDDSSESDADGKGGDDYETHEYCNMYDLY